MQSTMKHIQIKKGIETSIIKKKKQDNIISRKKSIHLYDCFAMKMYQSLLGAEEVSVIVV